VDQVVDADQDRNQVGLEALELRKLVIDQVLGRETVDRGVREVDLPAGLFGKTGRDDRGPALGRRRCAGADGVGVAECCVPDC
jgi:hypothetical protein